MRRNGSFGKGAQENEYRVVSSSKGPKEHCGVCSWCWVNSGSTSERWQLLTSFLATVHPEKLKVRPNC